MGTYLIAAHPPLAIKVQVARFFYGVLPQKDVAGLRRDRVKKGRDKMSVIHLLEASPYVDVTYMVVGIYMLSGPVGGASKWA